MKGERCVYCGKEIPPLSAPHRRKTVKRVKGDWIHKSCFVKAKKKEYTI